MTGKKDSVFCFVDLAGYTAMTEAHGDVEAAEMAQRFFKLADKALAGEGRIVKTIGDAVLVSFASLECGIEFFRRLIELARKEPNFLEFRAGLHCGKAVERNKDLFGADVNLTARITAQARSGEILCSKPVAEEVRSLGFDTAQLGSFALHNIRQPVEIFALNIDPTNSSRFIDPVCHMKVDPAQAAGMVRVGGNEYWFCSLECATRFTLHPQEFMTSRDDSSEKSMVRD